MVTSGRGGHIGATGRHHGHIREASWSHQGGGATLGHQSSLRHHGRHTTLLLSHAMCGSQARESHFKDAWQRGDGDDILSSCEAACRCDVISVMHTRQLAYMA